MSYNQPVVGPPTRPSIVTAAAYLMIAVGVLIVINAVIGISTLSTTLDATKKAYAGVTNADSYTSIAQGIGIASAIFNILIAAGFVILAMFNLRGANPARIVTWVLAGLAVLCFGCGLAGTAASGAFTSGSSATTNGVDLKAAAKQVQDALPSWVQPVQLTVLVLSLLSAILVIILLALPAANEFFRRPKAAGPDPAFPTLPYPQQ